jgi:transcriptional regulator with XRE-family HTH domain
MTNPLKQWRTEKNLSQSQAAELVGVDVMTLSRWERGAHLPHKSQWQKIEEKTGIKPADLIGHLRVVA